MKKAYKKWRGGEQNKENYLEERKEWRELCKQKEREWKEYEEEQLRLIKNENDVWRFLNKSRKKK